MLHSWPVKKKRLGGTFGQCCLLWCTQKRWSTGAPSPHADCPLLVALLCGVESVTPHKLGVLSVARPGEGEMLFLTRPSRGARHIATGCASTKKLAEPRYPKLTTC